MRSMPMRKMTEEDLKMQKHTSLARELETAACASNNLDFSLVVESLAKAIGYANALADLKADEDR